jgi:hypothetical protein
MNRMSLIIGFLALSMAVTCPSPVWAEVTDDNLAEKVAAAKTSGDHLEIAAYYRGIADASDKKVRQHERMLASVTSAPKGSGGAWTGHCKALIAAFKSTKKDAELMAQEHEAMAGKAGD